MLCLLTLYHTEKSGESTKSEHCSTLSPSRFIKPLQKVFPPEVQRPGTGSLGTSIAPSNVCPTISGWEGFSTVIRIVPAHPHFPSHGKHFTCVLSPLHYSVAFHVAVVAMETSLNISLVHQRPIRSRDWT